MVAITLKNPLTISTDDISLSIERRESNYSPQHTKRAPSIPDSGFSEVDQTISQPSVFSEVRTNILIYHNSLSSTRSWHACCIAIYIYFLLYRRLWLFSAPCHLSACFNISTKILAATTHGLLSACSDHTFVKKNRLL